MVKCISCEKPRMRKEVLHYISERIVSLYLGCECRRNRINWTLKDLATTFNAGTTTISQILRRYR